MLPNQTINLIRSGIQFEEKLIATIADDIQKMNEFAALSPEKRKRILAYLKVMSDDSFVHEQTLQHLADKY